MNQQKKESHENPLDSHLNLESSDLFSSLKIFTETRLRAAERRKHLKPKAAPGGFRFHFLHFRFLPCTMGSMAWPSWATNLRKTSGWNMDPTFSTEMKIYICGSCLKWWVSPTTMGFPTKNNQHMGCEMGVPPFKERPI